VRTAKVVKVAEDLKQKTRRIIRLLKGAYPDAKCSLNHSNAFELLIATILSAQCTDKRVNLVTPVLFKKYRTAAAYAGSSPTALEEMIRSTGFFRSKTKSIRAAAAAIVADHGGRVPDSMEKLRKLPGVGRKTANVVLGNAFSKDEGIVVDTHVERLSHRLRLTRQTNPEKIEQDLIKLVPQTHWTNWSHWLIWHGRRRCFARRPDCRHCEIFELCPSGKIFIRTGEAQNSEAT